MKRSLLLLPLLLLAWPGCSSESKTDPVGSGTDAGDPDAGTGEAGTAGSQCTAAREAALKPIDKVSTGAVSVVSDDGVIRVLYVDGSAGGTPNAGKNPAVFINLETAEKVAVTDKSSLESTDWDLSLKRTVIFTNGGDGGPGVGGAARVDKPFADVTSADGATMKTEKFFDEECNALLDQANYLTTTFSPDWYVYEQTAPIPVSPVPDVTYVVVGGGGKKYKVAIESYNGKPDGSSTAAAGGYFLLRIAPL